MKTETWRMVVIEDIETRYDISNRGRCRNREKRGEVGGGVLQPRWGSSNGYHSVQICHRNWGQKTFYLHRLVMIAFVGLDDAKPEVNHLDGDKSNNDLSNLEWCTRQENVTHAIENGLYDWDVPVLRYDLEGNLTHRYDSFSDIESKTDFKSGTIITALSRQGTAYDSQWRYSGSDLEIADISKKHKYYTRGVIQLTKDKVIIESFESVASACRFLGVANSGAISKVCKGKAKSAHGYLWQYK